MQERFEMECNFLDDTTTRSIRQVREEREWPQNRRLESLDDTELSIDPIMFLEDDDFGD